MLYVKIKGGLGNQFFQYFSAKAYSLIYKKNLKIIVFNESNKKSDVTVWPYELVHFAPDEEVLYLNKVSSKVLNTLVKIFNYIPFLKNKFYDEKKFEFDEQFFNSSNYLFLEGYFQSFKYFNTYWKELLKDIKFPTFIDKQNLEMSDRIKNTKSVSLHVRRGDYIKSQSANKIHGTCSLDYYKKAINLLFQREENLTFFIFSDDIPWCKNNLNFIESPMHFIDFNNDDKSYLDMVLMSQCKFNIIANSTFSWWAAWLNSNQNKIVIYPENWFSDSSKNTNDLFPVDWLKA